MEEREISIKELVQIVWKGKFLILIAAGILFVLALAGGLIYDRSNSQVSTIVTIQWSGVTKGEYPDGTRFDYNIAIEPYVITLALEEEGITHLTTNDIREAVDMVPIVPGDVVSLIQTALEEGEQISYYPTDYKIIMDNGNLDLTVDEGRDLLNELIVQFREDFERKFIQQTIILDFTEAEFNDYDYVDIYSILSTQITLIDNAMNNRVGLDPGFVSTTLGIGFGDILVRTSLVRQLELDQIDSRTTTYLLTKDKEYLITNYTYQIDLKQLELDKALINVVDAQTMVDDYTGSVNTIIIPGMDPTQVLEIDTYYNILLGSLVTLNLLVSELTNDISYFELQIDRLEGVDPSFDFTPTKIAEEIAKVESSITSADATLEDIVSDANTLLVEYNAFTTSNIIKPLMTPAYESSVSVLMISAVGLVLGAGIGTVVVLFKHDWE